MNTQLQDPEMELVESESGIVDRLAERLGASAQACAIFGDPIEREGVTVVPVATIRYGLGGGNQYELDEESEEAESNYSSGGGGGVVARPVGYIEIKDGASRFRPIRRVQDWFGIALVGGIGATLLLAQFMRQRHRMHLMHKRRELPM